MFGVLQRKHLAVSSVITIGKESNDLEESDVFGVDSESYLEYRNRKIDFERILQLSPKEARRVGISKIQLIRMKKKIRIGKFNPRMKTIKKLNSFN